MRRKKISEAVNEIASRHIEEAVAYKPTARPKTLWLRWAVPAACAALILIAAPFAAKWFQNSMIPVYDHAIYTAEDIDRLFSETLDGETSSYQKVHVSSADELYVSQIPEGEYVTIYECDSSGKAFNKREFTNFLNKILPKIFKSLDEEIPEYEIKDDTSDLYYQRLYTRQLTDGDYRFGASQSKMDNYIYFYSDEPSNPVSINGQIIQVDQTQTDEQIIESLASVKEDLFRIFGVKFKDVKVVRSYYRGSQHGVDHLNVYFFNADDHSMNEYFLNNGRYGYGRPVTDYINLSFDNTLNYADDVVSDKILSNVRVECCQNRVKIAKKYTAKAKVKLISLEDAEELLSKGYVFGGHSCELCMAGQTPVNFSDYDFVGFTYIFGRNDSPDTDGDGIPFYVFYKLIETEKNGNQIYARTYVPAVEVIGLEEYFEQQKEKHR